MTRKEMRKQENAVIMDFMTQYNDDCEKEIFSPWKRFRTCTAETCKSDKYILLRSYDSIVAIYDRENKVLYDVLRYVYGFTSTSAQHIAKFRDDVRRDERIEDMVIARYYNI